MKTFLKITCILVLTLLPVSCIDFSNNIKQDLSITEDFNIVEIDDRYSMAIPNFMKKTTQLNDEASLQYQNIFKEAYIVVIDESKENVISIFTELEEWNEDLSVTQNYRDIQMGFMAEGIVISNQTESLSQKINGLDAEVLEFEGMVEGIAYPITYTMAFIESDQDVFMVMAWTLKERKEKLREAYKQAIQSFKMLSTTENSIAIEE